MPHGTGPNEYRQIKVHRIVLEGLGERFSSATKLRNDYESFELLRKLGQRSARRFLDAHYDDIGVRSQHRSQGRGLFRAGVIVFDRMTPAHRRNRRAPCSKSTSPTSPRSMSRQSSTPPTARCSAAAAWTAPFIAPPGRNCWRNAARSAAAHTGSAKITRGYRAESKARHPRGRAGVEWRQCQRRGLARRLLPQRARSRRRAPACLARLSGDLHRHLSLSRRSRRAHRRRHRDFGIGGAPRGITRVVSAASRRTARSITRMRSRNWGWCNILSPSSRESEAQMPGPSTPCPLDKLRRTGSPLSRGRRLTSSAPHPAARPNSPAPPSPPDKSSSPPDRAPARCGGATRQASAASCSPRACRRRCR